MGFSFRMATIHFLLFLSSAGADVSDITNNAADNDKVQPKRKLVRRPDSERQLEPRKLTGEENPLFTRSYTVVTAPEDITFINPPNFQGAQTLQGSYFITHGGVFRSSSVELVPTFQRQFPNADSYVFEVLQPKTVPEVDDDFTFGGKCTTTNGKTITTIQSHSCWYDLCLGKPTDCVNIYAGTRFEFRPIPDFKNFNLLKNIQNNGLLNPEQGFSDDPPFRNLQNQGQKFGVSLQDDIVPSFEFGIATGGRAALPPSFPGFCIGGIGRFAGIKCSFDLITVAQRSQFAQSYETESPTSSPTFEQIGRDLSQEEEGKEEEKEEEERELQRRPDSDDGVDTGVIVQKIFITSNQRLPLGPKAI